MNAGTKCQLSGTLWDRMEFWNLLSSLQCFTLREWRTWNRGWSQNWRPPSESVWLAFLFFFLFYPCSYACCKVPLSPDYVACNALPFENEGLGIGVDRKTGVLLRNPCGLPSCSSSCFIRALMFVAKCRCLQNYVADAQESRATIGSVDGGTPGKGAIYVSWLSEFSIPPRSFEVVGSFAVYQGLDQGYCCLSLSHLPD
jgi:hypothetical protein